MDVQDLLRSGAALTDAALERLLPAATVEPHSIHRAMRHSTFAGGKRLRPTLALEAARAMRAQGQPGSRGLATSTGLPDGIGLPDGAAELGAAIEMVHTYSLIHDDLPALDNDELRRGQPTAHVVFGEASAILAGDALQTLAFQTLAQLPAPAATTVEILREFSLAIGTGVGSRPGSLPGSWRGSLRGSMSGAGSSAELPPGMIGGQVMDLESEGLAPTAELVERIHRAKTGALITASIVCGGLLGLGDRLAHGDGLTALPPEDLIARLRTFGENAGLAFQIVDDILDVTESSASLGKTAGKDTVTDKATWPAVFGLERSRSDAEARIADAFAVLEPFGEAAAPLKAIARFLVERTH